MLTCGDEDHLDELELSAVEILTGDTTSGVLIFTVLRLGEMCNGLGRKETGTYGRCSVLSTEVNKRIVDPLFFIFDTNPSFGTSE